MSETISNQELIEESDRLKYLYKDNKDSLNDVFKEFPSVAMGLASTDEAYLIDAILDMMTVKKLKSQPSNADAL
eukprot:CAMPEP_0170567668 /NCGR_PEP_ID=MMETSP0211-20121228/80630_1 /TAXON_ID=311385 /ORGANISM="Pseudokeronopsis sp., Strain OXSARD2" /LENGTH=73 /DNA_ID=CAMNT_0010889191 /DNA_START=174 /DNA_END=395 /DNA_ORIENTATION=-